MMKIKALFFLCFLWIPAFAQEEAIDIPIEECVEIHNGLRHILNNKLTSIFGYLHDDFQKHASDPEMIRIFGRFERVIKILELRNATYQPRNSRELFLRIKAALNFLEQAKEKIIGTLSEEGEGKEIVLTNLRHVMNALELSKEVLSAQGHDVTHFETLETLRANLEVTMMLAEDAGMFGELERGSFFNREIKMVLRTGDPLTEFFLMVLLSDFYNHDQDTASGKPEISIDLESRKMVIVLKDYHVTSSRGGRGIYPWQVAERAGGGLALLLAKIFFEKKRGATLVSSITEEGKFEGLTLEISFFTSSSLALALEHVQGKIQAQPVAPYINDMAERLARDFSPPLEGISRAKFLEFLKRDFWHPKARLDMKMASSELERLSRLTKDFWTPKHIGTILKKCIIREVMRGGAASSG